MHQINPSGIQQTSNRMKLQSAQDFMGIRIVLSTVAGGAGDDGLGDGDLLREGVVADAVGGGVAAGHEGRVEALKPGTALDRREWN